VNRDYEDLGGRDPWAVLGVRPDADPSEIKRAYRRRSRVDHADVGGDDDAQTRLNIARDVLLDPVRRHDYEERVRRAARDAEGAHVPGPAAGQPDGPDGDRFEDRFEWVSGVGPPAGTRTAPRQPDEPLYPQFRSYPQYRADTGYHSFPGYPSSRAGRPWNSLAIASLVVSLICWPVGLPMAVVALTQSRRRGERGAVLAWGAIGLSGLTLVLLCGQLLQHLSG
jgi:hypothetical protein